MSWKSLFFSVKCTFFVDSHLRTVIAQSTFYYGAPQTIFSSKCFECMLQTTTYKWAWLKRKENNIFLKTKTILKLKYGLSGAQSLHIVFLCHLSVLLLSDSDCSYVMQTFNWCLLDTNCVTILLSKKWSKTNLHRFSRKRLIFNMCSSNQISSHLKINGDRLNNKCSYHVPKKTGTK